ncbi:MAG: ATP-binding protein [Bacteroidales bacterium]|nr:ATP-binding protein [Bacteroidales bacterium]
MAEIIGRTREKEALLRCYASGKPEMAIVYGRRRIGKTFLIRETFNNRFDFYLTGLYNKNTRKQLENFANVLSETSGEDLNTPANWFEAFGLLKKYLLGLNKEGRKLVFLDEVPWMDSQRSDFVSALENFWNAWGSGQDDLMLVLCGSATAWMMDKILGDKGGLFNRDTERIYLEQFSLHDTEQYLLSNGIRLNRYEIAECYMVMGGVPYYLSKLRPGLSLAQNVDNIFFKKNSLLKGEFQHLYKALFKSSDAYVKIVEALSKKKMGLTRSEISKATGQADGGSLTKKLENLINSDLVRVDNHFGRKKKEAVYQLCDFFTMFYFTYLLNQPNDENYWSNSIDHRAHTSWTGLAFEQICMAHIPQIKKRLQITGTLSEYYAWRYFPSDQEKESGAQIDLVIDRRDEVVNLCEMKFARKPFVITKEVAMGLEKKENKFSSTNRVEKSIHSVLITTYPLAPGKYNASVQCVITLDDLFAE